MGEREREKDRQINLLLSWNKLSNSLKEKGDRTFDVLREKISDRLGELIDKTKKG